MSDEKKSTEQINDAAQAAADELARKILERSARESAQTQGGANSKRLLLLLLPLALLLGAAAMQYESISFWLLGPSAAAVQKDLDSALNQAAIDVKTYQLRTGALPAKLPNAALADIVAYRKDGKGKAVLTATIGQASKELRI